ncbi:unnamed protein product [Linum trigynum]|uniref:Uncharacterized protein n=1 Tax=Linum trigynum TaxID=586398 RepID=A0AAV2E675_9ROSI
MEAFQKEINDINGKLTGFDEKLTGFDAKLAGFDEMKGQLSTILSILSGKGKGVATNEEEAIFDEEDHYEQPKVDASSSKFILIPLKNIGEKDGMEQQSMTNQKRLRSMRNMGLMLC